MSFYLMIYEPVRPWDDTSYSYHVAQANDASEALHNLWMDLVKEDDEGGIDNPEDRVAIDVTIFECGDTMPKWVGSKRIEKGVAW